MGGGEGGDRGRGGRGDAGGKAVRSLSCYTIRTKPIICATSSWMQISRDIYIAPCGKDGPNRNNHVARIIRVSWDYHFIPGLMGLLISTLV